MTVRGAIYRPLADDATRGELVCLAEDLGLPDVAAFLDTCRRLNLPAALERSRSGRGAHVWLFFGEAIPAALPPGSENLLPLILGSVRQAFSLMGTRSVIFSSPFFSRSDAI